MTNPLDITRAGIARRDAIWAAGRERAVALGRAGHLTPPVDLDPYGQYLWLKGIADYCTATGRDLAGLDARPAAPVAALVGVAPDADHGPDKE